MRSTRTSSQEFRDNDENTMGRNVCSSNFSALMILEKNHIMPKDLGSQNALEESLSLFIRDLIKHGFIGEMDVGTDAGSKDETEIKKTPAQSFQERILTKALEPINGHDKGVVYNPKTKTYDTVEFSLCKTLTILLVALQDEQGETRRYWKSPYLVRLEKFYAILNPQVRCHAGFRNDWVKGLLHEEYDNMYFLEELGETLENIASDFFKEQLLKIEKDDPKRFYKILLQWIDVRNHERPDFEAFVDSLTTELQAFLESALLSMGLDPSDNRQDTGKAWEKSIAESLKLRIESSQSLACPHLPGFEKTKKILSEFIEKKKCLPTVILEKFQSCQTVKDLEDRALDVHRDFIYLRERAQHYNLVFPIGKEGAGLVTYVRVLISSLDKLLQDPKTAWEGYRETLKTCETQLEYFIDKNRRANNDFETFRNSFVYAKEEMDLKQKHDLYEQVKKIFDAQCLRITDEMLSGDWYETCLEDLGFFNLEQYDLNRVLWQALFISPVNWSDKFRQLLEGLLPQLESPIRLDFLHESMINSFPEPLLRQLKARLSICKIPLMINNAEHFFPANLDGITLIQTPYGLIERLQDPTCDKVALIEHLHFPAHFFNLKGHGNESGLETVLALLPKEKVLTLLPRLLNFGDSELLLSFDSFLKVLKLFSEEERWPFIQKSLEIPNSKTKAHFKIKTHSRGKNYLHCFNGISPYISRSHRIHLLKKLLEINANFGFIPLSELRSLLCQIPEKDWPEYFTVSPHPEINDDLDPSFIDFLPENLLPNFFKWAFTEKFDFSWHTITELFQNTRDSKCLPITRAIFELDEKILISILINYNCIDAFFEILSRIEPKDRAEYLQLLAKTSSKLKIYPSSNSQCLNKLSEEEKIEFSRAFSDPTALELLPSLPKSRWTSFCEQIGFCEKLARDDLSDFWAHLEKFEDKKAVLDFFKLDILKILKNPENFILALLNTLPCHWDKIPRLLSEETKWIDMISSYEQLYDIFSELWCPDKELNELEGLLISCDEIEFGKGSQLPWLLSKAKSHCNDLFNRLSPDLKKVIKTKEQLLGIISVVSSCGPLLDKTIKIWEEQFEKIIISSLSKGISNFFFEHLNFLDELFSSFEDYQDFFAELQKLNLSKEALFNFLRAPFSKKPHQPEQYEKMFSPFQEEDRISARDFFLHSLIPWPAFYAQNFLLTIYPFFNENTWPEGLFLILVERPSFLDMEILGKQYFMLWEKIGFNASQVEKHFLRLCGWLKFKEILHLFRVICAQDPKRKFNLSDEQKLNLFKAITKDEKFEVDDGLQKRNLFKILSDTGEDHFFFTVYRVLGHYQFYSQAELDSEKIRERCCQFWKGHAFGETKDHFLKICKPLGQMSLSLFTVYFEPLSEHEKKELLKEMLSSEEFQWPGYRNDIFPIIASTNHFYSSNALIKFMAHELNYFNWSFFSLSENDLPSLSWTHEGIPVWKEIFASQASQESFAEYFKSYDILKSIFSRLDSKESVELLNRIGISVLLQSWRSECFELIKHLPFSLGKGAGVLIPSFEILLSLLILLKRNDCEIGPVFVSLAKQEGFARLAPKLQDQGKLLELFNFRPVYLDIFKEKELLDSVIHYEYLRLVNQPELVLEDPNEFTLKLVARHIENIGECNKLVAVGILWHPSANAYETIFSAIPRYKLVAFINFFKIDLIGVDQHKHLRLVDNSAFMVSRLTRDSKIGGVICHYAKRLENIFSNRETYSECYKLPTLFEVIIGFLRLKTLGKPLPYFLKQN